MPALFALPAQAQDIDVSFDSFHDRLANYGEWVYSDRWGEVWIPDNVDADWSPYTIGHWVYTDDYGWLWVSDEGEWGDIVYHYGRWVDDPDDGWMWIPGYVWSPAWVVWRSSGDRMGWMPMPPDDAFLGGSSFSASVSFGDWGDTGGYYGYSRWYGPRYNADRFDAMWTFVPLAHIGDRDYRSYAARGTRAAAFVGNSHNVTNYRVVNNVVVNRSVTIDMVQRAGGHPQRVANATQVLRDPHLVTRTDVGLQIQARQRQADPRGNGHANSAPPPNALQVKTLSTRPVERNGRPVPHLFNQSNAVKTFHPAGVVPPQGNAMQPVTNAPVNPGGPMRGEHRDRNVPGTGATGAQTPPPGGPGNGAGPREQMQPQPQEQQLERRDQLQQQQQEQLQRRDEQQQQLQERRQEQQQQQDQLLQRRQEQLQQNQQMQQQKLDQRQELQQQKLEQQQERRQVQSPPPPQPAPPQAAPPPPPPPQPPDRQPPPDDKHHKDHGG
jgi:hypothetical protein